MNHSVYKYMLYTTDRQSVDMPVGAKILCVQIQKNTATLWCLVDTDTKETESRIFRVQGTGYLFDASNCEYIGTVQLYKGALVFHVFEELQTETYKKE